MPISGRFRITSIALPSHIDTIRPQNSVGLLVMTCGPGWMLWMVMAPTISAITALGGMPRVSSGMKDVWAAALLADSGPATPSMAPLPNSAEHRAQHRAAHDRRHHALGVVHGGEHAGDLVGEHFAVFLLLQVGHHFGKAEHAHG